MVKHGKTVYNSQFHFNFWQMRRHSSHPWAISHRPSRWRLCPDRWSCSECDLTMVLWWIALGYAGILNMDKQIPDLLNNHMQSLDMLGYLKWTANIYIYTHIIIYTYNNHWFTDLAFTLPWTHVQPSYPSSYRLESICPNRNARSCAERSGPRSWATWALKQHELQWEVQPEDTRRVSINWTYIYYN